MNATDTAPLTLAEGSIVTIAGDNRFTGKQGLVIDMNSDLLPTDGPIAVYFDTEVPEYEFNTHSRGTPWSQGIPTKENYRSCYRVICFLPDELLVDTEFALESIVIRKFGKDPHALLSPDFPLKPGTHACHVKSCESGGLATKLTLVNVWGTIMALYTCEKCHEKWHGARTDGVELKKPLPGAPAKTR